MATEPHPKPSFSPGRKWGIGFNVVLIVLIVFSVVGMINYLSREYFHRFQWSTTGKIELSPLTLKFLKSLTNDVKITIYYDKSDPNFATVAALLNEYKFATPKISVEIVDYLRDPAGAQKIKDDYKLSAATDKNLIIFDCAGRPNVVPGDALTKYMMERLPSETEAEHEPAEKPQFRHKPVAFLGETMFTAALLAVTNPKPLNACALTGHGEHPIDSGDPDYGYIRFASMLRIENYIRVEPLSLVGTNPVPGDCNLLIIAGPTTAIPDAELDKIDHFLSQGGRLFVLLNAHSANKAIGLENVLAKWGVEVGHNIIKDENTSMGADVIVRNFSAHPIVDPLLNSGLDLIRPRSIGKLKVPTQAADAPNVQELAFTGPNALASNDPEPKKFPLIVAVEKAAPKGVITERGSTRIVVVGDSIFLANVPIQSAMNRDFAGFAVNWLVDRTQLLDALGPRPIIEYKIVMTRIQLQRAEWLLLAAMPGSVLLLGALVWLRRRR